MPKRLISKYLPHASTVTRHRSISWMGALLHDSNLWHLNRRSVASAMFAGVFACFLPIPGQMLVAACIAIYFHCNLPLSIALTWISNPLTYAPIYYLCYRFGLLILGQPYDPGSMEWTMDAMGANVSAIMKPLMAGCIISGLIFGSLAYVGVRSLWRWHIVHNWQKRKVARAKQIGVAIKQKMQSAHCANSENNSETKEKTSSEVHNQD